MIIHTFRVFQRNQRTFVHTIFLMDPIDFPVYIHRSGAAHFREISNQIKSFATPRRRKTIRDPKDPQRHSDDVPSSEEENKTSRATY